MARAERYDGLRVVPNLDMAIGAKLYPMKLPPLPKTQFWNSPAFQALLNMQQQIETDAELEADRAKLKALMSRLALEARIPRDAVEAAVRSTRSSGGGDGPPGAAGSSGSGGGGGGDGPSGAAEEGGLWSLGDLRGRLSHPMEDRRVYGKRSEPPAELSTAAMSTLGSIAELIRGSGRRAFSSMVARAEAGGTAPPMRQGEAALDRREYNVRPRPSAFHRDPMEVLLPTHAAIGSAIAANGAAHAQLGAEALAYEDEEAFQRAVEAQLQIARRGSFLTGFANEAVPEPPLELRMAIAMAQAAPQSVPSGGEVARSLQRLEAEPPAVQPIRPRRVQYGGSSGSAQQRSETPREKKRSTSGPQRPRIDAFVQRAIELASTEMANESGGGVLLPKIPRSADPAVQELEQRVRRRGATQEPVRREPGVLGRASSMAGRIFGDPREGWRAKAAATLSGAAATALALQSGMIA
jgi:hypothetical protein